MVSPTAEATLLFALPSSIKTLTVPLAGSKLTFLIIQAPVGSVFIALFTQPAGILEERSA